MIAIFDKNCRHVGWINKKDRMIFDTNMRWLGFVENNNIYTTSCNWVGGWNNGTFVDVKGKPFAWENGSIPQGTTVLRHPPIPSRPFVPLTPIRPLSPLTPLFPLTPLGGWSEYEWGNMWKN